MLDVPRSEDEGAGRSGELNYRILSQITLTGQTVTGNVRT
jgi:hypothetical protein